MKLLIIERNPAVYRELQNNLLQEYGDGLVFQQFENGKNAVSKLRQNQFDVILVDVASAQDLHDGNDGPIGKICRHAQNALVIALAEGGSVSHAVEAMRAGAHDFMSKPINMRAFNTRITELGRRHGNSKALNAHQHLTQTPQFEGFVGASAQMSAIYDQIERIAPSSAPVFITGESGTGKEVCAQALHQRSPRAKKPFIAINCSAIPHDLMEGEIFGVVKGAYTGADRDRLGAAELANGGVLFLDEIGELDLGLQAKLLRFLQTGEISRVGDPQARAVDVRIICATNRNPMQLIHEKKFREDLFYRLHVLPIHLPPLRQRPSDILPLAQTFLSRYAKEEKKHFSGFSPETANLIISKEWPGNVRQLQNMIRRAVVMFDGPEINVQMLGAVDLEATNSPRSGVCQFNASQFNTPKLSAIHTGHDLGRPIEPMWQQEQRIIETALARYNGNISLAAAALEISPSTIYRKKQVWEQAQAKAIQANAIVA